MANSFSSIQITTASSILGLSEQGGYITEWKVRDSAGNWRDILYIGTELKRTGIPILFPYYGPSESGMGQHGFGRNLTWKLLNKAEEGAILELTEQNLPADIAKLYPYPFKVQVQVQVHDQAFTYTLSVQNTGSAPLPIAPGLHPYWAISHDHKKEVVVEHYPEIVLTETNWDKNPPDDEYPFKNPVTITFPTHQVVMEDLSEVISKLVVWSQPVDAPDHDFICFEPVTLTRKSFDSTPIMVPPGENWTMRIHFQSTGN